MKFEMEMLKVYSDKESTKNIIDIISLHEEKINKQLYDFTSSDVKEMLKGFKAYTSIRIENFIKTYFDMYEIFSKINDGIEFDTEFKKEEPREQELCYVVYSYNGETYQERDAEYVYITKNNQATLRDAIDRIISSGNIVGKIVLESELK